MAFSYLNATPYFFQYGFESTVAELSSTLGSALLVHQVYVPYTLLYTLKCFTWWCHNMETFPHYFMESPKKEQEMLSVMFSY